MAYCPKCGKEITDGSAFCPACGAKLDESAVTAVQENKQVALPENVSPKSRLCALLLGIFLGGFGVHNFYLGRIGRGIAQALMYGFGLVLYIIGVFSVSFGAASAAYNHSYHGLFAMIPLMILGLLLICASGIWSLVEWILIACGKGHDKNGLVVLTWTK